MALNNSETEHRKEFGNDLKQILKKNGIKVGHLATAINVTQGYISQVLNGLTIFQEDRFNEVCDYLSGILPTEDDIIRLTSKFYNAKVGKEVIKPSEAIKSNTIQRHFLQLFDQLTSSQQIEILNSMLQFIENNKNDMSQNAGLG